MTRNMTSYSAYVMHIIMKQIRAIRENLGGGCLLWRARVSQYTVLYYIIVFQDALEIQYLINIPQKAKTIPISHFHPKFGCHLLINITINNHNNNSTWQMECPHPSKLGKCPVQHGIRNE